MRWLPALLLLTGCGDLTRCSDAPLAGTANRCTRIEGSWLLEAGDERRCGAKLFASALNISSSGGSLGATVAGRRLKGEHYVSGSFELSSVDGHFSMKGEHRVVPGAPDELSGSVVFGGPGQECDALWDFTAHRE